MPQQGVPPKPCAHCRKAPHLRARVLRFCQVEVSACKDVEVRAQQLLQQHVRKLLAEVACHVPDTKACLLQVVQSAARRLGL